ncbi:hypothetical protein KGA66_27190, partial [Actinocrinis puniceicyclus]|nr:hypothetical protein [Actinocrinis puniceicyclus]
TTPCPPSDSAGATPPTSPDTTPTSSATQGAANGTSNGSSNGPGASTAAKGVLAHTGSGALAMAPLGAGLIGGGALLRKRFPARSH